MHYIYYQMELQIEVNFGIRFVRWLFFDSEKSVFAYNHVKHFGDVDGGQS